MEKDQIRVVFGLSALEMLALPGKQLPLGEFEINSHSRPLFIVQRVVGNISRKEEWTVYSIKDSKISLDGSGSFEVRVQALYYPVEYIPESFSLWVIMRYNKRKEIVSVEELPNLNKTVEEIKV